MQFLIEKNSLQDIETATASKKENYKKLFFEMKFDFCLPSNWFLILPSKQATFHMFYITDC